MYDKHNANEVNSNIKNTDNWEFKQSNTQILQKSKKLIKTSVLYSTIWVFCLFLFIILLSVGSQTNMVVNNNVIAQVRINRGAWIGGIVFVVIGLLILIVAFTAGILAVVKLFTITSPVRDKTSLFEVRILSIIGVVLCGLIIGTILLWLIYFRLSRMAKVFS